MSALAAPRDRRAGPLRLREWGGEGPGILLLHGMAGHAHWWDRVGPLLTRNFRPVALDFRGHGDSEWLAEGDYRPRAWLDDIEAARRALGWDRFFLCGHSMGARAALSWAEENPSRLRGVIAVDFLAEPPPLPGRFQRLLRRPQPIYANEEAALARFRLEPDGTTLSAHELRELGRLGLRRHGEGWSWKFDWRALRVRLGPIWEQLPRLRVPALLVRGDKTTVVSREQFERMAQILPGARTAEVAGAHHHVPLDRPEALAALLSDFACAPPS